jgi:hypothetical protein
MEPLSTMVLVFRLDLYDLSMYGMMAIVMFLKHWLQLNKRHETNLKMNAM